MFIGFFFYPVLSIPNSSMLLSSVDNLFFIAIMGFFSQSCLEMSSTLLPAVCFASAPVVFVSRWWPGYFPRLLLKSCSERKSLFCRGHLKECWLRWHWVTNALQLQVLLKSERSMGCCQSDFCFQAICFQDHFDRSHLHTGLFQKNKQVSQR